MTLGVGPIKVSYNLAKFGNHSYYGHGLVMILAWYVTLLDHAVKGPCDFMDGSPLW